MLLLGVFWPSLMPCSKEAFGLDSCHLTKHPRQREKGGLLVGASPPPALAWTPERQEQVRVHEQSSGSLVADCPLRRTRAHTSKYFRGR